MEQGLKLGQYLQSGLSVPNLWSIKVKSRLKVAYVHQAGSIVFEILPESPFIQRDCIFGDGTLDEVVDRLKNAKAKGGHKRFTCRVVVHVNKGNRKWIPSDDSFDVTLVHGEVKIISLHAQLLDMTGRRKPYSRGHCAMLYRGCASFVKLVDVPFENAISMCQAIRESKAAAISVRTCPGRWFTFCFRSMN